MSNKPINWPNLVLYGDSITQYGFSPEGCWATLLADKLQRKCDVLNRGFSGYNSRWNQIMLPRIINATTATNVVAMTIFLGANDSAIKDLNPKQYVPVTEYKENLKKMIDYLQSIGLQKECIILIGPPPCHEESWKKWCEAEGKVFAKDNLMVAEYSTACHDAANSTGVDFLELYNNMMSHDDWSKFLRDGLHFSETGSRFLFDKLWPIIEKKTTHLPDLILPYWGDVDHENPCVSLL